MNLVLTLASGYHFQTLKPLVASLRKTGYDGDIVMFVNQIDQESITQLHAYNVITINYTAEYPYFEDANELINYLPYQIDKFLSPNSLRYILYHAYLSKHKNSYDWVLHTDSRDVYFQLNPFDYYKEKGLYCFLEDLSFRIKDNKHNAYWIEFGFGKDVYGEMQNEPISCSGVTLGSAEAFLGYLEKMTYYINKLPNTGGLDQGIHNYLIYKKEIVPAALVEDDEGPVTTLTTFKPYAKIQFNAKGEILNNKNEVINIVHQYDRHLKLLWKYNKTEFRKKAVALLKRKILLLMGRKFSD